MCVGRVFDGGQRVCAFSSHWKPLAEVLHVTGIVLCTLGYKRELLFELMERRPLVGVSSETISNFSNCPLELPRKLKKQNLCPTLSLIYSI